MELPGHLAPRLLITPGIASHMAMEFLSLLQVLELATEL
jgi:hypothetical protein